MKTSKLIKYFLIICWAVLGIIVTQYFFLLISNSLVSSYIEWHIRPDSIPYSIRSPHPPTQQEAAKEYVRQAQKSNWTIAQINRGWSILYCESKFQYNARAYPKSSAVGIAQFLDGTWKLIAPPNSNREDYRINISMFIKYFPIHPEWWKPCL
jgi:hypothetical protein